MKITGYTLTTKIFSGNNSEVYKAIRNSDQKSVILKIISTNKEDRDLLHLQNELEITKRIQSNFIVNIYSLEKSSEQYALVMEDSGCISLSSYLQQNTITISRFLSIAIQLSQAIGEIHYTRIIHKDINPSNILINPITRDIKLIDFGISTIVPRLDQKPITPDFLEGTVNYISPEQTGRMNRPIDYRTDLYSLGITFYELLTGAPPFVSDDLLEQLHFHIAKIPTPIHFINHSVPIVISNIVQKLISKNAEDRYQNAFTLKKDLERCQGEFEISQSITPFVIASVDIPIQFQISSKLYGRENELKILSQEFESSIQSNHPTIAMVKGFSGIGKSSIVNEMQKPVLEKRGYYASGKFEQLKKEAPYYAFLQCFREIVNQILKDDLTIIERLTKLLEENLKENLFLLIHTIPELKFLFVEPINSIQLEPQEEKNRFLYTIQKFIVLLSNLEKPILLFLDDLQWADYNTLELLQNLLKSNEPMQLMLLGSYRNNEVDESHPLSITLSEIIKQGNKIPIIELKPLPIESINELLSDMFHESKENTYSLSQLLLQKTGGNPFFLTEFLKSLHKENLIEFSLQSGKWIWNEKKILLQKYTSNVVEFVAIKINKLESELQSLLKNLSCFGNQFDLNTIRITLDLPFPKLILQLLELTKEGYLISDKDIFPFTYIKEEKISENIHFHFSHDRIQQAAYQLMDEEEKQKIHLYIAQKLTKSYNKEQIMRNLFTIVNHWNSSSSKVVSHKEKLQLIELNLEAAIQSKKTAAFKQANEYIEQSLKLLFDNPWKTDYQLTLNLYSEAAEINYLMGNFEKLNEYGSEVLRNAKSILDKYKIHSFLLYSKFVLQKPMQTIELGREVLKEFGYSFPKKPSKLDAILALLKIKRLLKGKSLEYFQALPKLKDPKQIAKLTITRPITLSSYSVMPNLLPILLLEQLKVNLIYGIVPGLPSTLIGYSLILCGIIGDIEQGVSLGKIAFSLSENPFYFNSFSRITRLYYGFVFHWKNSLHLTLQPILQAYKVGIELGNTDDAYRAIYGYNYYSFFCGSNLSTIKRSMDQFRPAIKMYGHLSILSHIDTLHQLIINLLEPTKTPYELNGAIIQEKELQSTLEKSKDQNGLFLFYCMKSILLYTFGQYKEALEYSNKAFTYIRSFSGFYLTVIFYFYDSLIRVWEYQANPSFSNKIKIRSNQKKLYKYSKYCPENNLHKFYLVEAEWNRVNKKELKAMEFYKKAIELSNKNNFPNEEALAYELFAKFYYSRKDKSIASLFFKDAYKIYKKINWNTKAIELKELYNEELNFLESQFTREFSTTTYSSVIHSTTVDIMSIVKASQAISSEIKVKGITQKLLKIIIEEAGAEKGLLLYKEKDSVLITAEGKVNKEKIDLLSIPLTSISAKSICCTSIIEYSFKTLAPVIIPNASKDPLFQYNNYIQKNSTKSVLCVPLIKNGIVMAGIYLENNLTEDAFSKERVTTINLLSSQASISYENAQLYERLEEKVKEKTHKLNETLEKINRLKISQDEDYYLTSLLLSPLQSNLNNSKNIITEFIIKQKKQFQFQEKEYEVGGDLCITDNIYFNGTLYTVILNADAMGKSIQGAGGCLTAAVVFKASVERNRQGLDSNITPEAWLKERYKELHSIFLSFDGLMSISSCFGIINTKTGDFYYITAEHPEPILYRDNKTSFLEGNSLYKIGSSIENEEVIVNQFQLQNGDCIFIGSDGKDDLKVFDPTVGKKRIQPDNSRILSIIETSSGELSKIMETISVYGELIDDISILKISYHSNLSI